VVWRAKLGTFCRMLNLNSDNYKAFLKEWFGRNWVYHLRPLIQAIKLPEFYPANESSESIRSVRLTAIHERERLKPLLWSRLNRVGAESFGVTVKRVSPKVFVPGEDVFSVPVGLPTYKVQFVKNNWMALSR
jgi:hypothetical protein